MNKRQKKKLYKQEIGKNPPKKMKYSGKSYHRAINKPWISEVPESSYAVNTRNVVNTTKTLTAHRRKRGEWN